MVRMNEFYFGKITKVFPINHVNNRTKYQTEYEVLITGDSYAQMPCRAIRIDEFATADDYTDAILSVNTNVFVLFPKGDPNMGVIMGGGRFYPKSQDSSKGKYLLTRFNKVEFGIDKNFNYSVKSDSGPNFQVNTNKIVIDDSTGDNIVLDKEAKSITINANKWTVNVSGDTNITINGNCNITAKGNTNIEGSSIKLGKAAAESLVKGESFKAIFDSHTHIGNLGAPTSPPMTPMPNSALSKKVKTE
jgi:hypothetical protein